LATSKKSRVMALSGALLLLITGSALTITVIIVLIENNSSSNNASTQTSSTTAQLKSKSSSTPTTLSNYTPQKNITKLTYTDLKIGTGATVKSGDTVTVLYTGAVASTGKVFQSTKTTGQPVTFSLSQVIPGWQQGIPGMKVGGERRLYIPANLAYGANPPAGSGIPANAGLVFDVTVLEVK
jgi:peptidylprolyl isomerase